MIAGAQARQFLLSRVKAYAHPDAEPLPVAHRLALLYLLLPLGLWLAGWFRWWIGLPGAALLGLALYPALTGPWRGLPRRSAWGLLLAALIWTLLTAAGGVFDGMNYSWPDHRSVLLDLGRYPWPSFLPDDLQAYWAREGVSAPLPLLRHYLGWFMAPGLAARLWGPHALQWAVPLWTWSGAALLLLLFTRGRRGPRAAVAVAVLIFFSGLDIVRVWWWEGWEGVVALGRHSRIDGVIRDDIHLATPSHMTGLMWVPQHFLAAGLHTLLLMQLRRQPRFLAISGVALAATAFWSPLVPIGLLPLYAVLWRQNGLRPFLRWPNLILAIPLASLLALYLTAGSVDFLRGWAWEIHDWPQYARAGLLFYLLDFGALALLLSAARPSLRRNPFFRAGLLALLCLPLYVYGGSNDLLRRGSLPALMVLAWFSADVCARPRRFPGARSWAAGGVACALLAGACTPVMELARATRQADLFRYDQAQLSVLADRPWNFQRQKVAFAPPPLLRRLLRAPRIAGPALEPGAPLFRHAGFAVYWDQPRQRLIYAKALCSEADAGARLFLQQAVTDRYGQPLRFADFIDAADALPQVRFADSTDYALGGRFLRRTGDACGRIWNVPDFDVAVFRTGQPLRGTDSWDAALLLDTAGDARVTVRDARALQTAYQAATAEAPRAEDVFAVYFVPEAVTVARGSCLAADREARFFLHAVPAESQDLPSRRRPWGFDNLDFAFPEYGAHLDGPCWATVPLPPYALAQLRIGQFTADGTLWRVDIPFHAPDALREWQDAYRAVTAQAPIVRAVFDVYLVERTVTFVKNPCRPADVEAKFTLHAVPVDSQRLPASRRRLGFENLGFPLAGYGARWDGLCLARRNLPAYPIERLRVGQYLSRERRPLWQAEIPVALPEAPARSP